MPVAWPATENPENDMMTNEVLQLNSGAASARLVPAAGGRVSTLRLSADGGAAVDVLHPYPEDHADLLHWGKGGIYPLLPYSNRIAHARLSVPGAELRLRPHPDAQPHTLHGHAHRLPWRVERCDASSAGLSLAAPAGPEWPWHLEGRLDVTLHESQLLLRVTLRNADTRAMPAGIGLHPYFCHVPDAALSYRARTLWPGTPEFLATHARAPLADEIHDTPRPLPPGGLTRYAGDWDGTAEVQLPARARLRIEAEPVFGHLVVHRPDNQAYLCLEPVSHVADGFNLAARGAGGTGTRWLQPGESLAGEVRLVLLAGEQA